MYKLLFKTEIRQILYRKKKTKLPPWIPYIAICIFCMLSFYVMYAEMAGPLAEMHMGDVYFTMVGSMTIAITFFTNVTMAQNQLFESKYNDVLLSMPLTARDILISRTLIMLVYNYILEMIFGIPGMVAWIQAAGFELPVLLVFILLLLICPLRSMSLGIMVGYVLLRITARSKHKNLTKIVLYFGFMILYYFVILIPHDQLEEMLINSGIMSGESTLSFIAWFGKAVYLQDVPSILCLLAVSIIPFIIVFSIVSRNYFNTMSKASDVVRIEYREKELKTHSLLTSLLIREIRHFVSSFTYFINNSFSLITVVLAAVVLFFGWDKIFEDLLPILGNEYVMLMVFVAMLFMITTYMISATSISIEGASIEALKTFPIDTIEILNSKILFHYILMAPGLFLASLVLIYKARPGISYCISVLLLPQLFLLFTDVLGVWLNLRHPKLDWENEAQVVKRGLSVFLVMLIGMGVLAALMAGYFLWLYQYLQLDTYMLVCTGTVAMAAIGFYLLDTSVGVRIFNRLD